MSTSSIEWTDKTWNPVSGCTRVSAGCDNCYAVTMTKRLDAMGQDKYSGLVNLGKGHFNGQVKCHEDALLIPLRWKKPCRVFVNSMSDLFHKEVPFEFIDKAFAVMALTPHITYQILTKRPERMAEYLNEDRFLRGYETVLDDVEDLLQGAGFDTCDMYDLANMANVIEAYPIADSGDYGVSIKFPLQNVWLGTSVESQEVADERIPYLLRCPAAVRFLSCEPLIGPVNLTNIYLSGCGGSVVLNCLQGIEEWDTEDDSGTSYSEQTIHWVIVGGESGPNARPMHPEWARSLRDQCQAASVPFFFKQWGEFKDLGDAQKLAEASIPPIGRIVNLAGGHGFNGESPRRMAKIGKHRAGRLLDGREWNEFPKELK